MNCLPENKTIALVIILVRGRKHDMYRVLPKWASTFPSAANPRRYRSAYHVKQVLQEVVLCQKILRSVNDVEGSTNRQWRDGHSPYCTLLPAVMRCGGRWGPWWKSHSPVDDCRTKISLLFSRKGANKRFRNSFVFRSRHVHKHKGREDTANKCLLCHQKPKSTPHITCCARDKKKRLPHTSRSVSSISHWSYCCMFLLQEQWRKAENKQRCKHLLDPSWETQKWDHTLECKSDFKNDCLDSTHQGCTQLQQASWCTLKEKDAKKEKLVTSNHQTAKHLKFSQHMLHSAFTTQKMSSSKACQRQNRPHKDSKPCKWQNNEECLALHIDKWVKMNSMSHKADLCQSESTKNGTEEMTNRKQHKWETHCLTWFLQIVKTVTQNFATSEEPSPS